MAISEIQYNVVGWEDNGSSSLVTENPEVMMEEKMYQCL